MSTACQKCQGLIFAIEERDRGSLAIVCANHRCGEVFMLMPPPKEGFTMLTAWPFTIGEG